jgi:hypothetical protein
MHAARPKRVPTTDTTCHLFERRDDFIDRRSSHDLAIRARTQQRLERGYVLGDFRPVFRRGAERIRPVGDSIEDDVDCALSTTTASKRS